MEVLGVGVEPTGQFLHQIRRVATKADFFRVCAKHHDDGPGGGGERGVDRAKDEGLAVDEKELLRRSHPRGFSRRENHGAETEGRKGLTHE